ncbi:MAG: PPOX class F420-dependent oxidoreductase [Ilumatobacteraceae bacterium]|jgi:PPOX class probable F420-dependent enzyme
MATADVVGAERYVLLTTRKRDGSTVATPVWIANLRDGTVGFTTEASAGKVKRVRNFPDVTLRPCDRGGAVTDDAPLWTGRAVVLEGSAAQPVITAVKRKYGWQVTLIDIASAVRSRITRRPSVDAAIIITLD